MSSPTSFRRHNNPSMQAFPMNMWPRRMRVSLERLNSLPDLPEGTLAFGASGDGVEALQKSLHALGYLFCEPFESFHEKGVFEHETCAALARSVKLISREDCHQT